ncbi:MAG: anti-sigma factor [Burkholderiales bacterium]
MNWKQNAMLQDRLAAEYVLGTLRGPARARFARWMREDATLRRKVAEWDARILPMSAAVPERPAPARVWEAVASRTGAHAAPAARSLWDSLAFWRGLGLAASGMAAALLVLAIAVPPRQADAPPPVLVRAPSRQLGAAYIAVLSDAKTQKPVLLASAARDSTQLFVKTLDKSIHVDDGSLELWALPSGKAPRSLGVLAADDKLKLALHAPADESLGDVPALAVSLEPRGGSPTGAPTGPVLFSGPCVRHW